MWFSLYNQKFYHIFVSKSHYIGIMQNISTIIKERRKTLSITQQELAELAGVGINTLTKIERGEANPSLEILHKVLDTLGLEIEVKVKSNTI